MPKQSQKLLVTIKQAKCTVRVFMIVRATNPHAVKMLTRNITWVYYICNDSSESIERTIRPKKKISVLTAMSLICTQASA